jgi:hypothetical protein
MCKITPGGGSSFYFESLFLSYHSEDGIGAEPFLKPISIIHVRTIQKHRTKIRPLLPLTNELQEISNRFIPREQFFSILRDSWRFETSQFASQKPVSSTASERLLGRLGSGGR